MPKYQKTTRRYRKVNVGLLIVLVIAIAAVFGTLFYLISQEARIPSSLRNSKNNGNYSSVLESTDDYIIAAHYPKSGNDLIDEDLKTRVLTYVNDFKANYRQYDAADDPKVYYSMDYDQFAVGQQYFSVILYEAVSTSIDSLDAQMTETLTYDQTTGQLITLDDLFKTGYLKQLAAMLRQQLKDDPDYSVKLDMTQFYQNTLADTANFSRFILDNDQIRLFYDSSRILTADEGTVTVDLPVQDLDYYLNTAWDASPQAIEPSAADHSYLRYIDPNKPMIALTFDDGPYDKTTDQILDTLADNDSAATFFVVGNRINYYPDTIKEMVERGNEIGNHSYTHKFNLTKLDYDALMDEINKTQTALNKYVENYQIEVLRPTFGAYNDELKKDCGCIIVNWSVDTQDWKSRNSEKIVSRVIGKVKDGDIILMHDIYQSTADAVKQLVPELIAQGYQLVTVSELLEYKGLTPENGQVYFSSYYSTK